MEQFEQIRRDHAREGLSIRELAKRHGVHRRAVRQALESAIPPPKRAPESRPAPKLGPYRSVIDEILEADRQAPRKQRHTARRIWQRLVEEHGAEVSERQVCRYVQAKRRRAGRCRRGVRAADQRRRRRGRGRLGEAKVLLRGELVEVHLFEMRACFSGAAFVMAFRGRDPAGVPGGARPRVGMAWRRVRRDPVRQPQDRGRARVEGSPAGRVRSVRGVALALPVRVDLLPPRRSGGA